MTAPLRVAAVQLRAHDRSEFADRLRAVLETTRAAASGTDLLVLPEATFPGYVLGSAPIDESSIASALDALRAIAVNARTVIIAGAAVRSDRGARNAAIVIDADGSLAGRADKLFLWHFDRRWFEPGNRLEPIATSIGVLGVLVCADGRLPTISRALVDRGAVALVMPTAWVTSGRNPSALENVQADLLARVRAYENRVPFIAANKCGSERGMVAYCGKSQIIDARGEVVAIAGEREPEILRAAIALAGEPPHRTACRFPMALAVGNDRAARLAISIDPLPQDVEQRLELLDDAYVLSPHDEARLSAASHAIGAASVDDDLVLDPAGLVPYRRAGYRLICWATDMKPPWSERLARARALELRLYFVVFERSQCRAFAVDPDGTIVAGTFDGLRIASFAFEPSKTAQTTVAPGTDISEGLERVRQILGNPGDPRS